MLHEPAAQRMAVHRPLGTLGSGKRPVTAVVSYEAGLRAGSCPETLKRFRESGERRKDLTLRETAVRRVIRTRRGGGVEVDNADDAPSDPDGREIAQTALVKSSVRF